MIRRLGIVSLVAVALVACSESPQESLLGCFAASRQGPAEFRIVERGEGFALVPVAGKGPSEPLRTLAAADLRQRFGADAPGVLAGFANADDSVSFFRLDDDATMRGAKLDSAYLMRAFFGDGTVYRKDCPSR